MIMKRKLPSQADKLNEDLLEEDKKTEEQPQEETKTSPSQGGASGGAGTQDTSPQSTSTPDEGSSSANTPEQQAPETSYAQENDESAMTRSGPLSRPQDAHENTQQAFTPRKHKISTEALLDKKDLTPEAPQEGAPQEEGQTTGHTPAPPKAPPKFKDTPQQPQKEEDSTSLFVSDVQSDDDTWDLGDLVDVPDEASNISNSPFEPEKPEISSNAQGEKEKSTHTPASAPPWKRHTEKKDSKKYTPELPNEVKVKNSKFGALISLGLVVVLIGGTTVLYKNRDIAVEGISRWTGTLNEVGQPVPQETTLTTQEALQPEQNRLKAESVVRPDERAPTNAQMEQTENTNISLEVLDVPKGDADDPIIGDESVEIPEDIDKFSALQRAIAEKRSERRQNTSAKLEDEAAAPGEQELSPTETSRRNAEIIRQTNKTLAEYRKALAEVDDPSLKPRPGDFISNSRKGEGNTLPPPNRQQAEEQPQAPRGPELFGNRVVSNLSELLTEKVIKEETTRTLNDFDVSVFDPRRPQVSIPKGLVPRLSKEDFPPLEVLSFVSDQGLIAKARGTEGVLLIGETLEGWELVTVETNYAEFMKNGEKRIVTFNNANR